MSWKIEISLTIFLIKVNTNLIHEPCFLSFNQWKFSLPNSGFSALLTYTQASRISHLYTWFTNSCHITYTFSLFFTYAYALFLLYTKSWFLFNSFFFHCSLSLTLFHLYVFFLALFLYASFFSEQNEFISFSPFKVVLHFLRLISLLLSQTI